MVGKLTVDLYRRELAGKACRRVEKSDDLPALIERMTRIAKESRTFGLSAPQVGVYIQLAIVITESRAVRVLVNPEIVNLAGRDLLETENCLSLPPIDQATARIWRSEFAHVRSGTVENPDAAQLTVYNGTLARRVQHEIDHLHGIFFIDRCQSVARNIVLRRFAQYLRRREIERRGGYVARAAMRLAS